MAIEHIRHRQIGDVPVTRIVELNAHEDPFTMLSVAAEPDMGKPTHGSRHRSAAGERCTSSTAKTLVEGGERCAELGRQPEISRVVSREVVL